MSIFKKRFLLFILTAFLSPVFSDTLYVTNTVEASSAPNKNNSPKLAVGECRTAEAAPCLASGKIKPLIELKAGYFFFADGDMRKVYNHGGFDLQLSGSYPIWKWLQIYGSFEYLQANGKSLVFQQKTSIWEIPLSLGLKSVARINRWASYYFTLGPRYFFVHVHNDSSYVDKNLNQNGLGGFVGTGFTFSSCGRYLVDIFGEYSYIKMDFHPEQGNVVGRTTQLGGFVFGAGVGYQF